MKIIRYKAKYLHEIYDLHVTALKKMYLYGGSGAWEDDLLTIEDTYMAKGGDFLIGVIDHRVVAMGGLKRISANIAEITRMRVAPDLQGQGLGTQMLSRLIKEAKAMGYKRLELDTALELVPAQHLYKKFGFREVGRGIITRENWTGSVIYFSKDLRV